jgi:nitroreductase
MSAQTEDQRGMLEVIYRRRAVRSYTPERISEATVRQLIDAAIQAPTALHLEPWAFVVVQDPAALKRYSDRAKALVLGEAAKNAEAFKLPGAPPPKELLGMLASPDFNIFYNASTLIVICGRTAGGFASADCWLAAENLMLAACALGLGSCCIGFAVPALNDPEIKRELNIPEEFTAVAPLIIGVPSGPVPPVPRKPAEILSWVR